MKVSSKAFTLAEIMITLLIIGVVASIILPAIIEDTQNEEFYTLLKKDYSIFSDAAKRMMMDNGGNLAGLFTNGFDIQNKFGEHIILTKKCSNAQQGCFYAGTSTWQNLHGDDGWFNHTSSGANSSTAILSNGGLVFFQLQATDCENNYGTGSLAEHTCGWIHIDVNGFKGPNTLGRDIYALFVTNTGMQPFGIPKASYHSWSAYCNKDYAGNDSGQGCAAKVLSGGKVD